MKQYVRANQIQGLLMGYRVEMDQLRSNMMVWSLFNWHARY